MSVELNNEVKNVYFEKHSYGVIFLDILGQKELIRKFENSNISPENEEQLQKILNHLLNLLYRLNKLKEFYSPQNATLIYETYRQNTKIFGSQDLMKEITPERIQKSLEETSFGIQQFSDTTLLYARLDGKDSYIAKTLFSLLVSSLPEIMLDAFSKGIFFRGAICIGDGWEIEKGNLLYGPVLHQAYELEEKVAQWPRIVLSSSAVNFFKEEYLGLSNLLSKYDLSRRFARSIFCYGIDYVLQLHLLPMGLYEILCLGKDIQMQNKLSNILQEVKDRINEMLQVLNKQMKKEASNVKELSKLIMRYRILKRDLLDGACQFEMVRYTHSEKSKDHNFEFPKWIQDERPDDIGFLTTKELVLKDFE